MYYSEVQACQRVSKVGVIEVQYIGIKDQIADTRTKIKIFDKIQIINLEILIEYLLIMI